MHQANNEAAKMIIKLQQIDFPTPVQCQKLERILAKGRLPNFFALRNSFFCYIVLLPSHRFDTVLCLQLFRFHYRVRLCVQYVLKFLKKEKRPLKNRLYRLYKKKIFRVLFLFIEIITLVITKPIVFIQMLIIILNF